MNEIDKLYKQLCGVESKIEQLSKQRSKIRKEIAVLACPYNIGDILVITDSKSGSLDMRFKPYLGFNAIVKDIRAYSETWEVVVEILNKDNSPTAPVKVAELVVRSTRFLKQEKGAE